MGPGGRAGRPGRVRGVQAGLHAAGAGQFVVLDFDAVRSIGQGNGTCVEMADLPDGRVAARNSTDPDGTTVVFTRPEILAWISGVKAGEFDDLAR